MPTYFADLPSGQRLLFDHNDPNLTDDQIREIALNATQAPPALPTPAREDPSFTEALGGGFRQAVGMGGKGLGALTGLEGLERRGEEFAEEAPRLQTFEETKQAYEEGLLPGLAETLDFAKQQTGQVLGGLGAYIPASFAGAKAGASLMPIPTLKPAAAVAGSMVGPALQFFGSNLSRQEQVTEEALARGETPPEMMGTAGTLGTAVTQAGVERLGLGILGRFIPGLNRILGQPTRELADEELARVAQRSLLGSVGRGAAAVPAVEVPVELAQTILERNAAGLPLTTPDALQEYEEVAAATVAGTVALGGAGGAARRSGARSEQEFRELQRRTEADATAAEAEQAALNAEREARRAAEEAVAEPTVRQPPVPFTPPAPEEWFPTQSPEQRLASIQRERTLVDTDEQYQVLKPKERKQIKASLARAEKQATTAISRRTREDAAKARESVFATPEAAREDLFGIVPTETRRAGEAPMPITRLETPQQFVSEYARAERMGETDRLVDIDEQAVGRLGAKRWADMKATEVPRVQATVQQMQGSRPRMGETFGGPQRELSLITPAPLTETKLQAIGLPKGPVKRYQSLRNRLTNLDLTQPEDRQIAVEEVQKVDADAQSGVLKGKWAPKFVQNMQAELARTEDAALQIGLERDMAAQPERDRQAAVGEEVEMATLRGLEAEADAERGVRAAVAEGMEAGVEARQAARERAQATRAAQEAEAARVADRAARIEQQAQLVRDQAAGRLPISQNLDAWKDLGRMRLEQNQEESRLREQGLDQMAADEAAAFELDMQYVDDRITDADPMTKADASAYVQQYREAQSINDPELIDAVDVEAKAVLGSAWGSLKNGLKSRDRAQAQRLEREARDEQQPKQPDLFARAERQAARAEEAAFTVEWDADNIKNHPWLNNKDRERLDAMVSNVGWAERGGFVIRDDQGTVTGRTSWVPKAPWWKDKPKGVTENLVKSAYDKIKKGDTLNKAERRSIAFLAEADQRNMAEEAEFMQSERQAAEQMAEDRMGAIDARALEQMDADQLDALKERASNELNEDASRDDYMDAVERLVDAEVEAKREEARPGFDLTQETEEQRRKREANLAKAEAEAKAQAKQADERAQVQAEVGSFALAGSPLEADQAAAAGQASLFPSAGANAPIEKPKAAPKETPKQSRLAIRPDGLEFDRLPPGLEPDGILTKDALDVAAQLSRDFPNAPPIEVRRNQLDPRLPQALVDDERKSRAAGKGASKGVYYDGKVYLFADSMLDKGDAYIVGLHEILGHDGLRMTFGDTLRPILRQIVQARGKDIQEFATKYGYSLKTDQDKLVVAEEVLANLAMTKPELGFVKRAIAAIRRVLRQIPGIKNLAKVKNLSDNDIIANFIIPARAFAEGKLSRAARDRMRAYAGRLGPERGGATVDVRQARTTIDKEYFDAVERGDMEEAQRLVNAAAERAGVSTFADDSGGVGYKLRRTGPPKKTVTVYKAFRLRDGKLYPMFVGAEDDLPIGVWLDATEGGYHFKSTNGIEYVPADTGDSIAIPDQATREELIARGYLPKNSVAKKIKAVAYRPGWHGGELPFFPQAGNKVFHQGRKLVPEAPEGYAYPNVHEFDTVIAEVEMDADYNYRQEYLDTATYNKTGKNKGKINPKMSGLRFIPKGGYYEYATNPLFENRPDLGKWFISGSVKINRILSQEETNKQLDKLNVPRQLWNKKVEITGRGKNKIVTEGPFDILDLTDLGYDPQFNHVDHKLIDPITYDDDGNVIPLSQRFDISKPDIRYSRQPAPGQRRTPQQIVQGMGETIPPPEQPRSMTRSAQQALTGAFTRTNAQGQRVRRTAADYRRLSSTFGDFVATNLLSKNTAVQAGVRRAMQARGASQLEQEGVRLAMSDSQVLHRTQLANMVMEYGKAVLDNATQKFKAVQTRSNFKNLTKELSDIAQDMNVPEHEVTALWHNYVVARRLDDLRQQEAQTMQRVQALRARGKNKKADDLQRKFTGRVFWSDAKIDAGLDIARDYPEVVRLADMWNDIRSNVLDLMVTSGTYTREKAEEYMDRVGYAPFFREGQLEAGDGPREYLSKLVNSPLNKRLTASDRPVNNMLENMMRWTGFMVETAVGNHNGRRIIEELENNNLATPVPNPDAVPRDDRNRLVEVYQNGVKKSYLVEDPLMVKAFEGLGPAGPVLSGILGKLMGSASELLRKTVTMNPVFTVAQLTQDAFGAMMTSGLPPQQAIKLPVEVLKEFIQTINGTSASHETLRRYGAVGERAYNANFARDAMENRLTQLNPETRNHLENILDKFEFWSMASDNAVRQAVYKLTLANGESAGVAVERAFEIINFRRQGSFPLIHTLARITPFMNAYMQSLKVQMDLLSGGGIAPGKARREVWRAAVMNAMMLAGLSFVYAMLVGGDEDYEQMDDLVRDRMFYIPGLKMGVPLRSDMTLLPKIIGEQIYRLSTDAPAQDMPQFRQSVATALTNTITSPTPLPQLFKPIIENVINYSFWTNRPLVSPRLQELTPSLQRTPYTSQLAALLGENMNISPIKIDNWVQGTFGSLGGLVLWASDNFGGVAGLRPSRDPFAMAQAFPGMGRFLTQEHSSGLRSMFYEADRLSRVAYQSYMDRVKNQPLTANPYLERGSNLARVAAFKEFNQISKELGEIRRNIDRIGRDVNMDPDTRAYIIDQLRDYEQMILEFANVKDLRERVKIFM